MTKKKSTLALATEAFDTVAKAAAENSAALGKELETRRQRACIWCTWLVRGLWVVGVIGLVDAAVSILGGAK